MITIPTILIILLVKIYCITWLITHFEPIQEQIDNFMLDENNYVKWKKLGIIKTIYNIVTCHKCLTFWTVLVMTQNIVLAAFMSMIAETHKKYTK